MIIATLTTDHIARRKFSADQRGCQKLTTGVAMSSNLLRVLIVLIGPTARPIFLCNFSSFAATAGLLKAAAEGKTSRFNSGITYHWYLIIGKTASRLILAAFLRL
jgi:hypothetical protein